MIRRMIFDLDGPLPNSMFVRNPAGGPPFLLSARRRRENLPEKIRICIAVWRPAVQWKQP